MVACGITCSRTGNSRVGGEAGDIAASFNFDAYGGTQNFNGSGADDIRFTDDDVQSSYGANGINYCGYRHDAETENYYVRNRYYSPVLGRWITRNPIGYSGGVNLYGYVESSPVRKVAASGLEIAINETITGESRIAHGAKPGNSPDPALDIYTFKDAPRTGASASAKITGPATSLGLDGHDHKYALTLALAGSLKMRADRLTQNRFPRASASRATLFR